LPVLSRLIFALGGPLANICGAFLGLSLMNTVQLGFSVHSAISLPLAQIASIAIQICAFIPLLFSQPDQLFGIVGIVAVGGAHVGLDFIRLLQFSALLNLNLAILNLVPVLPLDGGKIVMAILQRIYQPARRLEFPLTAAGWILLLSLTIY